VQFDTTEGFHLKSLTEMKFEMILMFKPDKPQSIFVPLKVIDWNWRADLHRDDWDDPWEWEASSISVEENREAEKFPKWDHVSPDEVPMGPCK
jgi:hypothetical protein